MSMKTLQLTRDLSYRTVNFLYCSFEPLQTLLGIMNFINIIHCIDITFDYTFNCPQYPSPSFNLVTPTKES